MKERMVEVVIGDPYKFSVILQTIPEWNIDDTFCNGILLFGVNGDIYPSKILTATLTSEIQPLKEKLTSLATDECLFSMEKKEAFKKIYDITMPEDTNIENDYRFDISPMSFADDGCFVFAIRSGCRVRILASQLKYNIKESRHDFEDIYVNEAILELYEINELVSQLKII